MLGFMSPSDPRSDGPTNGHATDVVAQRVVPSQRCTAHTTSGKPCGKWAIVGGMVCATHGGSAPQVREAARRRILAFAPRALATLEAIAADKDQPAASRVRAAIDLLDRAGLKVAEELAVIPQEATNAALDAAIANALAARGHDVEIGDQDEDDQDQLDS